MHKFCTALMVGAGSCLLAGCLHVAPVPIDLPARAAARNGTAIDLQAVRKRAGALVPDAAAARPLDRLMLFAAILEHDPRVVQARAAVDAAARDAVAARKAAGPTLTLTSEYARDPAAASPWLLGAGLDLPLDMGGRRAARLDRAGLAVVAARDDLAETIWAERTALNRGLVDVFAGEAQALVGERIVALRDAQLASLAARVRAGEMAGLDLQPYRQQRAAAARALDDARTRRLTGTAAVAGVLGVPAAALAAAGPLAWPDFEQPAPAPGLSSAQRQAAMSGRADVLRKLAEYDQAEADLRGEVARQAPAISLGPGYTWERGLVKLPFSLNLALPSFDLNHAAIRAAEARRAAAGAAIETALADAQAAIQAAEAEQAGAAAALARVREGELPAALAVARQADERLRLGAIDHAEHDAARIAALEAELTRIDAVVRLRLAIIALEAALHRPLDGPETQIGTPPRTIGDGDKG